MQISEIIPAYNCEKYICQTLDCVKFQSLKKKEIIILLDNCTDNTEKLVKEYAEKNSEQNIKIIKFDKNNGPSFARNTGIRHAQGEYIHFMDADDFIGLDFYEQLYKAAKDTNADIACSSFLNERFEKDSVIYTDYIVLSNPQDKIDYTKADVHGFSTRYIFKRNFWIKNKFKFPEDMYHCEDLALMTTVINQANRLALVPYAFYHYKHRQNSLVTDTRPKKCEERQRNHKKSREMVKSFLEKNHLQESRSIIKIKKFKIFRRITLVRHKFFPDQGQSKVYFLEIPICKINHSIEANKK